MKGTMDKDIFSASLEAPTMESRSLLGDTFDKARTTTIYNKNNIYKIILEASDIIGAKNTVASTNYVSVKVSSYKTTFQCVHCAAIMLS